MLLNNYYCINQYYILKYLQLLKLNLSIIQIDILNYLHPYVIKELYIIEKKIDSHKI